MSKATLHVPVRAQMQKVGNEWKMVEADYADVPADAVARKVLAAFGVSVTSKKEAG